MSIKATFTLPKLTTKKVWAGMYGGHYDIIVFFREKPIHRMRKDDSKHARGKFVDTLAESRRDNILGDTGLGYFYEYFPDVDLSKYTQRRKPHGLPRETEIPYNDLFELELTAPFNDHGYLEGISFECDWPIR